MIDTKLLDLINSGDSWVFVGSGLSVEAGLPSWQRLVALTLDRLGSKERDAVNADPRFRDGLERQAFPRCFQRMQALAEQSVVIDIVRQIMLDMPEEPAHLTKLLADWPAAGYLTTNYDQLIETALETNGGPGWIPIGNQPSEVRKVSGDVSNIVWHIHGSVHLDASSSKLILSTSDYDELYLGSSVLKEQLISFLTQRRLVFIGFGLRDPEIMRLLRLAGRYTIPERPVYAFLGTPRLEEDQGELEELRDRYNIEVQSYRIVDGTHRELRDLLGVYNSMIVRRSVTYNEREASVPSYDPDATGLLIYNTLVLQAPSALENKTLRSLLSARILSVTEHQASVTLEELDADVGRIASRLSGGVEVAAEIKSVVTELESNNYVTVNLEGDSEAVRLTTLGNQFVSERAGVADRIREQFRASLQSRASMLAVKGQYKEEVAATAAGFFEDCIKKRSLGVAMALNAADTVSQEFQMVALLQALPSFFGLLSNPESARALVQLVQGVLTEPTEAEAKHCGLLLQAQLGVHLLGVDQHTLSSRIRALEDMVFVLDSTTLIHLIAVSGTGHKAAVELMKRIDRVGAKAITTPNLIVEVCEHATYATRTVTQAGGGLTSGVLNSLMGKKGPRTNAFLSGFAEECAMGTISGNDFAMYMRQRCGFVVLPATSEDCNRLFKIYRVVETDLPNVTGFAEEHYAEVEDLKAQITERRQQSNNFRHERQVKAEAEVVILVQKLRRQDYSVENRTFDGAFFVSNSRFIDQLNSVGLPITIRQNVLLQWLGTLAPFDESELHVLMDGLLWELSERGFDFVNKKKLRTAFSGVVSASREEYNKVVEQHKILVATELGVDPDDAFQEPLDDLEFVSLVPRHALQTIDRQKRELKRIKASAVKNQVLQELSETERTQFERLKSRGRMRIQKNRKRAELNRTKGKKATKRRKQKRKRS